MFNIVTYTPNPLNFGKFFNNSSGGQIIINPDGNFEANGIDMFDSNVLSSGTFTIGGLINREVQISFTDAIIIFTTNAGKQLYENSESEDFSGISRKTVLKA